ncbi:MAG: hypothetical protein RIF36_18740 [Imperialibacter sp.]|uniref:hypothetical protein n=1 Tax=Imperialibacter sp. TaxID=2038411 RepID=UPI0032ED7EB9
MRKLLPIIPFILGLIFNVSGQDHLEPTNGVFSELKILQRYYNQVSQILLEGLSERPAAQLVILPSFSKEVVWQVHGDTLTNKFYAVYRTGSESIWYTVNTNDKAQDIKPLTTEIEISKEAFQIVSKLFAVAISNVKYPINDRGGTDGANYFFSSFQYGQGTRSGTIWSPDKKSIMRRLVKICDELILETEAGLQPTSMQLKSVEQLTIEFERIAR